MVLVDSSNSSLTPHISPRVVFTLLAFALASTPPAIFSHTRWQKHCSYSACGWLLKAFWLFNLSKCTYWKGAYCLVIRSTRKFWSVEYMKFARPMADNIYPPNQSSTKCVSHVPMTTSDETNDKCIKHMIITERPDTMTQKVEQAYVNTLTKRYLECQRINGNKNRKTWLILSEVPILVSIACIDAYNHALRCGQKTHLSEAPNHYALRWTKGSLQTAFSNKKKACQILT